jgi:hypothetical protein
MGSRESRREENQKLFRLGNERLRTAVEANELVPETRRIPFLCECADEFCNGRVDLRLDEWEGVAAKESHFVVVAGHPRSEGEKVVGTLDGYDIVSKT